MAIEKHWGAARYTIYCENGETLEIIVSGRDRWALETLISAGALGCTPFEEPGPRWSGYVHNLRNLGVPIETVTERHGGPFKGTHARYVLSVPVTRCGGRAA